MLELSSNKIKALGIFGRLSKEQEEYFDSLEKKYSDKPDDSLGYDVFRHLTLTFINEATVSDIRDQLDLLHDLKKFLPVGEKTVETPYTKIVWFVPKINQQKVMDELADFKELIFTDFYLVANKQNDENTIYTTKRFEM